MSHTGDIRSYRDSPKRTNYYCEQHFLRKDDNILLRHCTLTRAVTASLLVTALVRMQSLDLDTQKVLLAEIVGPPQGVTVASNVASV